ncbi:hypothetical protein QO002_005202 [Pararhizobium capsulatum DSM 1112]|uniref:Uncharacterized protein n=1 Tax=Pararhizobium capsulatum DSM 1112 TaxID=1121113 RepID=A0ABU0BXK7_9HYPH|nr:hypothetical protein [Pararhizobium capsulatum DSM 1112]
MSLLENGISEEVELGQLEAEDLAMKACLQAGADRASAHSLVDDRRLTQFSILLKRIEHYGGLCSSGLATGTQICL